MNFQNRERDFITILFQNYTYTLSKYYINIGWIIQNDTIFLVRYRFIQ